jgi:hypothetical protein
LLKVYAINNSLTEDSNIFLLSLDIDFKLETFNLIVMKKLVFGLLFVFSMSLVSVAANNIINTDTDITLTQEQDQKKDTKKACCKKADKKACTKADKKACCSKTAKKECKADCTKDCCKKEVKK